MRTRLRALALVAATALPLAACATIEGVGYDLSAGARTVSGWFGG